MGKDLFDVINYLQITFVANSAGSVDDDGSDELRGNIVINGISKRINSDVEFGGVVKDPLGNEKAGFTIIGKLNPKDFGLNRKPVFLIKIAYCLIRHLSLVVELGVI